MRVLQNPGDTSTDYSSSIPCKYDRLLQLPASGSLGSSILLKVSVMPEFPGEIHNDVVFRRFRSREWVARRADKLRGRLNSGCVDPELARRRG